MDRQYYICIEDKGTGAVTLIGRNATGAPWPSEGNARSAGITIDKKHGAEVFTSIVIQYVDNAGRVIDTARAWLD